MTAAPTSSSDPDLQRRLQQDSIQLAGKVVYLNPFLYWRRFDANTDRWLREPGQLPEEQISANRRRFYPELDWDLLSEAEVAAAIEATVSETGAESIRDMGRVIGALKSRYTGQMDFGAVGPMVRDRLG